MKNIVLLGSTGSVGRNVLDVVRQYPDKFGIKALSSNENVSLLSEQAEEFKPEVVVIGEEKNYSELKEKISPDSRVLAGMEGLEETAAMEDADIIFVAISGTASLKPLVTALEKSKVVALASKEPVVSAGQIIMHVAEKNASSIIPVDSEHSAIMQCLAGKDKKDIRTLYITGTGGPLKGKREEELDSVSVDEVLAHPKWNMGQKITVDSATLMNKGLEVIEARWLFGIPPEMIKVVIHPEAIVHSMVEFIDGTINANMFYPDMRFPILRALAFPDTLENDFPRVDFCRINNLSFSEPDLRHFPALELAYEVLKEGGTMPAVLNSANEAAVKSFLAGKISFTDIMRKIRKILKEHKSKDNPSLEDIIAAEKWAYKEVLESC
ncbi:MAG: 1-deoxy-D-xylulose-5-phosphate reductoisomerase [Candidatus Omnitrophota bacterium]|jgi:1-deoxy-D-xylulose-5-phosphate reductoisomerase